MPKAIVELICEECQSPFSKSKSEHQRTVKRGYRQFCSRPCGHEYKRKNGEAFVSHLELLINFIVNFNSLLGYI
mgnify:CR=1 FL=1